MDAFTDWLKQLLDSGWQGEGMNNPEEIHRELKVAICLKQDWDSLIPKAKDKFCAMAYYQARWAVEEEKPLTTLPDFIADYRAGKQQRPAPQDLAPDGLPPGWSVRRTKDGRLRGITDTGIEVPLCEGVGTEQEQAAYRALCDWRQAHAVESGKQPDAIDAM